jgi:hypothetical protein
MPRKIKPIKTINPLHFEDLEPHRFEDLVRRLLYNFRDWNNIEPVGRGGSDDGFDVRAWEKGDAVTNVSEEGEEGLHALEGRLWQVQCKRERTITPGKMRTLIRDGVDSINPPYGYILAAATNISKTAYDVFREELRKNNVTEFYFWGKDHLDDQLSLPQHDEILFTFFGLSLSPRRRSLTAELKFNINNKNKVFRLIFGRDESLDQSVPRDKTFLLRDVKAEHYPDPKAYPDFEKNRRWEEHDAAKVGATGVFFKVRERYAYFEQAREEWDLSMAVDLCRRKHSIDQSNQARLEDEGKRVEGYWRHLPLRVQAKLMLYGFVPFEWMLIIDDRGDPEYTHPHIYVDFGQKGPFQYLVGNLVFQHTTIGQDKLEQFKRVSVFPTTFPEPSKPELHELDKLAMSAVQVEDLKRLRGAATLYSFDKSLRAVKVGSVIYIPKKSENSSDKYVEVTHISKTTVGAILKEYGSDYYRSRLQGSANRSITDTDRVDVFELHEVLLTNGGKHLIYLSNDGIW